MSGGVLSLYPAQICTLSGDKKGRAVVVLIVDQIKVRLTPFQRLKITEIDAEDFSGVKRKVAEELAARGELVSDAYLEQGVLGLKQYYVVALLDPAREHAVSPIVDRFWHAHILHTRRYADFCERVFGQFIHHEPLDHADQNEVEHVGELYRYTVEQYDRIFQGVDHTLYPVDLAEGALVCTHYEVHTERVRKEAIAAAML